jgi:hypothetical protein
VLIRESSLSIDLTFHWIKRRWRLEYPEINAEPIVYRMVADMLGLEDEMCRMQGLVLMVSLDKPFCIGFVTSTYYKWRYEREGSVDKGARVWTICLGDRQFRNAIVLLVLYR